MQFGRHKTGMTKVASVGLFQAASVVLIPNSLTLGVTNRSKPSRKASPLPKTRRFTEQPMRPARASRISSPFQFRQRRASARSRQISPRNVSALPQKLTLSPKTRKIAAKKACGPVKPHLRFPFSPVLAHQWGLRHQNTTVNRDRRHSRKRSPLTEHAVEGTFKRYRAANGNQLPQILTFGQAHVYGVSRTRSRSVPDLLTKAPEPHHSSFPQNLTTSPAKLHLTGLEPLPDKALP
jgi:hypothetical protein